MFINQYNAHFVTILIMTWDYRRANTFKWHLRRKRNIYSLPKCMRILGDVSCVWLFLHQLYFVFFDNGEQARIALIWRTHSKLKVQNRFPPQNKLRPRQVALKIVAKLKKYAYFFSSDHASPSMGKLWIVNCVFAAKLIKFRTSMNYNVDDVSFFLLLHTKI